MLQVQYISMQDNNNEENMGVFGNILAVCEPFFGLELAFVGTKFSQKLRVKGITNQSRIVYMTAGVEFNFILCPF